MRYLRVGTNFNLSLFIFWILNNKQSNLYKVLTQIFGNYYRFQGSSSQLTMLPYYKPYEKTHTHVYIHTHTHVYP